MKLRLLLTAAMAALLLIFGITSDSASAEHAAPAKVTAPAETADVTLDICRFTNPNPSTYVEANWRLEAYYPAPAVINNNGVNVHQHLKPWCRWVGGGYGPLCRVIQRHNNPGTITWGGDDWDWHVVIDYWSCPTRPW